MFPTVLVLAFVFGEKPKHSATRPELVFPAGVYIVQAKAIVASAPRQRHGGFQVCTLKIERVFVGDHGLLGKHVDFTNYVGGIGINSGTVAHVPRDLNYGRLGTIKVGEQGIWPLARERGKLVVYLDPFILAGQGLWWFPFRDAGSDGLPQHSEHSKERYSLGRPWAIAVQDFCKAKDDDSRVVVLKKYALAKDSPISAWAIWNLGKLEDAATTDFLSGLALKEDLSVLGQTVLDRVLSERRGQAWDRSKERRKLLDKWITTPLAHPEYYKSMIMIDPRLQRIGDALKADKRELAMVLQLLEPLVVKDCRLPKDRENELASLLHALEPTTSKAKQAVFTFLVRVIERSPFPQARESAASAVNHCLPLDKQQIAILKKTKRATPDETVAEQLRQLLNFAER
jgi:hypothetical protein